MAIFIDIGNTIKDLIQNNISELKSGSIVFDSPAEIDPPGTPMLSIFLYQIVENSFLKNSGPEFIRPDYCRKPPLTMDLCYIITPYARDKENELIIMEKVLQLFHDTSVLKGDLLKGKLKDSGNDEIRIFSNSLTFEEINKLWERFPSKAFKLSAAYTLSPVRIPSGEPPVKIPRVMEKEINLHRKEIKADLS
jgi:hypothetical protein